MVCAEGEGECEGEGVWQRHARLPCVLEAAFGWLGGAELARAGAACRAWREAARASRAWRRLLRERAPHDDAALRALADLYEGACPWRELFVAAAAPWRRVACLQPAPAPPARLSAAALAADGDTLALAADDCSFTIWKCLRGRWEQESAGSVAWLGWSGVSRAEWAPRAPRLLLAGPAPLAAARAALAVLAPAPEGGWRVVARAGGAGGCWAGAGFLSLELARLSPPARAPRFATDVWLNAATQEADNEFSGVAARVLRVYNEAPAAITQVACAETPLDERAAREWAEAEARARAEDEEDDGTGHARGLRDGPVEELAPGTDYYEATRERESGGAGAGAFVRLALLACGGVLGAWPLPRAAPPPLRVHAPLAARVAARRAARRREAAAVEAGAEEAAEAPEPSVAELRARCAVPAARARLPGRVLGLHVHPSGRCVWASVPGGALCASLPALAVLRAVALPAPAAPHYLQAHSCAEYFGSPCGGGAGSAHVWGAAPGAGAALRAARGGGGAALALLLPPVRPRAAPRALLLDEDAVHVWQCCAPRAPAPPPPRSSRARLSPDPSDEKDGRQKYS